MSGNPESGNESGNKSAKFRCRLYRPASGGRLREIPISHASRRAGCLAIPRLPVEVVDRIVFARCRFPGRADRGGRGALLALAVSRMPATGAGAASAVVCLLVALSGCGVALALSCGRDAGRARRAGGSAGNRSACLLGNPAKCLVSKHPASGPASRRPADRGGARRGRSARGGQFPKASRTHAREGKRKRPDFRESIKTHARKRKRPAWRRWPSGAVG